MIAFFPDVYPDELAYSWFARYGVRTGYLHYRAIADDLFTSNTAKPNIEFLIRLNQEAYQMITSILPFEDVIMKHTMFPYYARFLPLERRQKAYDLLKDMDKAFYDALYIRRTKTQNRQFLRYCPECVKENRNTYGETYWHRLHQLDHVDLCPIHGCYLLDSEVTITSKASPSLIHADTVIPDNVHSTFSDNSLELKVAQYVAQVFSADINTTDSISLGKFMHHKMEYTKYLTPRGVKRLIGVLYDDFSSYYRDLPNLTITESWQLENIFTNRLCHTYDICLLAMFLGIPVSDLLHPCLPKRTQSELFDEQIILLHEQGLNYRQISQRLGASYDYCKLVAYRSKAKHHT